MRDLVVFLTVVLLLPTAFRKPFIGLLVFSWLAYMRPQDLCWSFARFMRFSFLVGVTMVLGWYVNESHKRRFYVPNLWTRLLLALAVFVTISLLFAAPEYGPVTWRYYTEFLKIVVVSMFTISQVDTRKKLRLLLWVICGSLAFYAVKNGIIGVLKGGTPIIRGPGGMLEDNNDFALALVMNIPLLYYLGRSETKQWIKKVTILGILLTMITVLLLHSRGGFLAMTATLLMLAWRSGRIVQAAGVVIIMTIGFFMLAPEHVIDRIATIFTEGTKDTSAASRIVTWSISLQMVVDNPVWGIGLRNFLLHADHYAMAAGYPPGVGHVSHNSYLQVWAEGGSLAFATYMILIGSVFWSCGRIRNTCRYRADMQWAFNYARMMEAVMVGFMVGAMFLNRGHFDLMYHFIAITACLTIIVKAELAKAPEEEKARRPDHVTVRVRPNTPEPQPAASGLRQMPRW